MFRVFVGIVVGVALVPVSLWAWFQFGHPPVAVADAPIPYEGLVTHVPLEARIHRDLIANPPIQPTEANYVAGAHVYAEKCATCHGLHTKPSAIGRNMFPAAPPLWEKHPGSEVVGVSDDKPGETYWKVANGIRLTGMPAYKTSLTDTEIWQVSLLLASADKPLPPSVLAILRGQPAVTLPEMPAPPRQ